MEVHYLCWNGPCQDRLITDCPTDAQPGMACAVPWTTTEGKDRYAVYVLLARHDGQRGLVFERSYETPGRAQRRVEFLTHAVAAARQTESVS